MQSRGWAMYFFKTNTIIWSYNMTANHAQAWDLKYPYSMMINCCPWIKIWSPPLWCLNNMKLLLWNDKG
jgi:hypothetical protein